MLLSQAHAASVIVAHYQMGELEYNGGAGTPNGGTAPTLLASTGSNMGVSGTPVLVVGTGASNAFGSAAGSSAYMSFDGVAENYQTTPNLFGTATTTNWIMEAWVRPTAGGTGLGLILSHGHGGVGVVLNYDAAANQYGWFIGGVGQSNSSVGATAVGTAWDHVALVRNAGTLTLYVNGTVAGTGSYSGGYVDGSAIGSQFSGGADHGFTGDMDDVYFSTISGTFNAANDLHMVPEPSVALLGALGVLGLLRRRR